MPSYVTASDVGLTRHC